MFLKSITLVLCFLVCFTQQSILSYSYSNDLSESENDYYDNILSLYTLNEKYRYTWMRQIMDEYNSFSPSITPTEMPTISSLPSNVPTGKPYFRPSHSPTPSPSKLILKVPTFQPTYQPNYIFDQYNISS